MTRHSQPMKKRTVLRIPNLSDVPTYSEIESLCRRAGEIPHGNLNRAHSHRTIIRRIERKYADDASYDDVDAVHADVDAITAYYGGEFDRRQQDGRPIDETRQHRLIDAAEQVQRIRITDGCTRNEAIRRLLERHGYAGQTDLFKAIRNYINR
jgi:hypothetical protein